MTSGKIGGGVNAVVKFQPFQKQDFFCTLIQNTHREKRIILDLSTKNTYND